MKNNQYLIPCIILGIFLIPLTLGAQEEKTKTFNGIKSIRMNTSSGIHKIQKSTNTSVTVLLRHTYKAGIEHTIEQDGDRLIINETLTDRNARGESSWMLTVPDDLPIRFLTGSGNIDASDIKLDLDATTGSGDLVFRKVTGHIKATTGSGDLELQGFNGDINVTIGSGNARVENSQGNIRVNCGSGTIRVADSKAKFRMNNGSGNVVSRNITLDGSSQFNSGSGNAQVILAVTPQHNLSVNSGSGAAELNFNGNEIAGEIVMRANKRTGIISSPFPFDKEEEISGEGGQVTMKKTFMKGNSSRVIEVTTGSGEAIIKK